MKKLVLSFTALALTAGSALAADPPSRKAPILPPPPPPSMWTGFYAGLNAGYGFGTNSNVQSVAFDSSSYVANSFGNEWVISFAGLPPALLSSSLFYNGAPIFLPTTGAALSQSSKFSNTQNGFVGGAQFGYNYQWREKIVFGFEADIQGTGIRGNGRGAGLGGASAADPAVNFITANPPLNGAVSALDYLGAAYNANAIGVASVTSGVDWMGTVRGRVGYLWTQNLLVYGAGGFTYGGVYTNVRQYSVGTISENVGGVSLTAVPPYASSTINASSSSFGLTYFGGGQRSQVLTGWNVGGGFEWMFAPNWSLKAEGLYWNMGSMNVQTATVAAAPQSGGCAAGGSVSNVTGFGCAATSPHGTVGSTRVNYQGVIARAGINYHFDFGGAAPVITSY